MGHTSIKLKAITICQPYAHLIVTGTKPVENRTWRTHYRGSLAIHAGKSRAWLDHDAEAHAAQAGRPLVFGAIVAICTLADCLRIEDINDGRFDDQYPQLRGRQHCFGPWCWVLTDVLPIANPVPWRGAQGLFDVSDALLEVA